MIDTQDYIVYPVEKIEPSASAIIVFARHPYTHQAVVLKVLRGIKDERYDLSTLEKRQRCQIEALTWNPKFTPDIYLGLAPIRESLEELERGMRRLKEIGVGPVWDNPEELDHLPEEKECALLMHRLPEQRRLDTLLEANRSYKSGEPFPSYLLLLVQRVCAIHKDHTYFKEEAVQSGSLLQLGKKLEENLSWLEKSLGSKLILEPDLFDTCERIKEALREALNRHRYQAFFESRLEREHIKRCHGDLKADNIWVEFDGLECDAQPETCVRLLDCIDFKPLFCMIDTLSDIALLVADIQARTENLELANAFIDEYLYQTGEEEKIARYLLAYYIVEKAMIGIVNSYIDNKNDELGKNYSRVADQRVNELMKRIQDKSS